MHDLVSARCGALIVLVAVVCTKAPAHANEPAQRVVVLGVVTDALLERVEGQTSDLPWVLVRRAETVGRRDALGEIRRAARAAEAPIAIWFEETDAVITVFVLEVAEARLFARRIADVREDEPMGSSARLEAAALVVRAALRDLADGGHIGVVVPAAERTEDADRDRRRPRAHATISRRSTDAGESARARATRFVASAGWAFALDGHSPTTQHGPAAVLAVEHRWARLELGFSASLGAELVDDRASVRLVRHAFRLGAGAVLDLGPSWSLAAMATGGVGVWSRATVTVAENVSAAPETTSVLGMLGVEIRAAWRPIGDVFGVEPVIGLDVTPGAPVLGYLEEGRLVERNRLWIVSPWFGLGATVRTR